MATAEKPTVLDFIHIFKAARSWYLEHIAKAEETFMRIERFGPVRDPMTGMRIEDSRIGKDRSDLQHTLSIIDQVIDHLEKAHMQEWADSLAEHFGWRETKNVTKKE